jgi:hypothetical protein
MTTSRHHRRLDRLAEAVLEEPPVVIAYAPSWTAEDDSVPPPPAELAVPAWTEEEGWIDAESRTVGVLLHAPA